ncbi:hypothetical protein PENTCL1PPCAC_4982, partial [Pristionchus entomophagus]
NPESVNCMLTQDSTDLLLKLSDLVRKISIYVRSTAQKMTSSELLLLLQNMLMRNCNNLEIFNSRMPFTQKDTERMIQTPNFKMH